MNWPEYREKLLSDPKVRAEYEKLRPEYEEISRRIKEANATQGDRSDV